ncbi:short chain dehydrogenase reductase [Colletotrichum plurivorum]|uniref:Short chain dehydrogenase reductase n=1 Tax=Colletotrichum plurivorum TaxID=2175906 RepID=A0A8H6KCD0_9PEZI|nr:short chain dehydrogenase reductase [Colletotrichum plurivorum]
MSSRLEQSGGLFTTVHRSTTYDYISPLKLDLSGRHVLITGAAWEDGVGYATATAFARAGASAIAVADLHGMADDLVQRLKSAATEAGRPEPKVLAYTVDISNQASVQKMREAVAEPFSGRLDILINNAAHMEPPMCVLDPDPDDLLWRTWEVNVHGLLNMTRAFLSMQLSSRADGGACTIINVASSGALSARPSSSSYRSSKLAVLRWTESVHLEYAEQGLLAFCVNPGAIKTRISEHAPQAVRDRFPDKADVAGDTIAWLASERRDWLAGRYVSCPWDMEEVMAKKDEIVEGDKLKMRMVF